MMNNRYFAKKKAVASRGGGVRKVVPIFIHATGEKQNRNMPAGFKATGASTPASVMEGTVEIRDPLFNPETLYMPRNIERWNMWIRHYYRRHPLVGNCVDIHSTLPFSNPRYGGIEDKTIADFFDWSKEDVLHLYDWILASALEYTLLGEQFSFATFNSSLGTFDSITVLNPDLLDVFPLNFGSTSASRKYIISMKVPKELREIYQKSQNDERFRSVFNSLMPEIRSCVISGQDIPLDPNNIFAFQRLVSQYDKRGTSVVVRVMDWLMYEDKLRTAQMATADGNITPKQLWKLGNVAAGYMPTAEDIAAFNELLAQGEHQDFFQLVTHEAVQYQSVVPSQGMMDIGSQFDLCQRRILMGLYASDAWMGNDGPSYCFDEKTEILTENGWRKYYGVEDNEKLATFNKETEEIEYQNFSERIVNKNYSGPMCHFKTAKIDVRVSGNHRMLVKNKLKYGGFSEWRIVSATEVRRHDKFRAVAKWTGISPKTAMLFGKEYPIELVLKFMGYFISEGWYVENEQTRCKQVAWAQNTDSDIYQDMDKTMSEMGLNYHKYERPQISGKTNMSFVLCGQQYVDEIKSQIPNGKGSRNIYVPHWIKQLSPDLLKVFMDAMVGGDGNKRSAHSETDAFKKYYSYITFSPRLANDVQEIVFKMGIATKLIASADKNVVYWSDSGQGGFPLVESGRTTPNYRNEIRREDVEGETIWCFTVPNQFLVTRRNGIVSIQGNSNAVVSLKVLKGRYKVALSMFEQKINDMNRKIAIANGFRRRTKAELDHNVRTNAGALIIPEISWPNNLGFNENYDRTQILIQLAEKHKISYKTLLDELGVDDHEEAARLEKEMDSPLADGYYEQRVQQLLDTAEAIKNGGKSFGIGKDKVSPALPSDGGGGGGEGSAAPAAIETGKPNVRENPENMKIPTGGSEMLESV